MLVSNKFEYLDNSNLRESSGEEINLSYTISSKLSDEPESSSKSNSDITHHRSKKHNKKNVSKITTHNILPRGSCRQKTYLHKVSSTATNNIHYFVCMAKAKNEFAS